MLSKEANIILDLIVRCDAHSFVFESFEDGIDYWYKLFASGAGGDQHDKVNSHRFRFNGKFMPMDGGIAYKEDFSNTGEESSIGVQFLYSPDDALLASWKEFFDDAIEVVLSEDEIKRIRDVLHGLRDL